MTAANTRRWQPAIIGWKLTVPSAIELEKCWREARAGQPLRSYGVKLAAVTFIDLESRDYDSKLQNVAASIPVSLPEWTPVSPLKRGEVYTWQVTATKAGQEITSPVPPAPEARFKILEPSKVQELSNIKNSYPESHLVLGSVYRKAGLLDDAEREFRALLSANPHSAVAQKLLQEVKSLRQK